MSKARARVTTRNRKVNGGVDGIAKRREEARHGPTRVKVGLPAGSTPYPDGTSVIEVGATHEFGDADGTIPERSFLRSALRSKATDHNKLVASLQARVNQRDLTMREALEILGTKVASDVKEQIVEVSSPPNSAETIRRKGSSNPLIDTGHLRQSITHEVIDE